MIVDNLFENHTAVNTAQAIARELHATLMDLVNIGQAKSQQGAGHPEYAAKLRQEAIALAGDLERLGYEFDFKSPGYIRPLTVDNQPQRKVTEMQCPECGGAAFTDLILAEKKDACYYKVKASAKVWPSAYASGRLVQCRKRGAANYGNKSRNEDATDSQSPRQPVRPNTPPQPIKKRPATPFGPGTQVNEFAPSGPDGGDDGFSEETLKRLAAQWYNGDEDPRVERTLAAAGWEIGWDEGYDDEPGVFVVQAGDVNGNSYISWPAHELKQGVAEDVNTGPQIIYATGPRTMGVNDVDLVFKDLRTGKILAHVVGNNYHPGDDRLQEFAPPDRGNGGGGDDNPPKTAKYEIRMSNSKQPTYLALGDPLQDSKHEVYKLVSGKTDGPTYYGMGMTLVSNLDWWSFVEKMLGEIMWEDDAIEAGLVDRKDNGDLVFLNKQQGVAEMDKSAPQPGRDGKISHSTYGSRDKKGSDDFKGKEAPGKAITAKQASKDALDILKKQGVAEGSLKEFAPGDGNGDGDDNGDSEIQRRLIMLKSLVRLQQDLDPASIQVWYVSRTDMYHASGQRPGEDVVRLFKYTYNPQSKKFMPVTSESLADDFADFARQRGIKVRVAGTPEQERERSRALQAERAKANELRQREQALADRQQLDDLESKFADMKARYDSLGGSAWQYADREQNLTAAEREARSMESDLNTLYARIQRAKQVDDLNEGPVTDNAVKLIKGLGLAGIKGVQGLWWAVNNPGKALALAAVTTHPKETWNAANFAWNLVTDPGHVVNVLGRRAAADMPIAGKWVDKAQAAQDLQKIMGNTATSDMVFRLADLAVDNALPIAGVIALLYGGHKFIQYLRDRNAIPPGEKAFQRISQELGADRLPKPNSTPTQPPVSEVDVKDQAQPMKLADYLAQAEALQAKLSQAARDNDREVIQQLENQRRELDAQARRGLVPESKKSDDLVGGRHTQDQFDDMIGRLKQLANAGPLKTVWDPQRQVYRNVPVKPKQDKK